MTANDPLDALYQADLADFVRVRDELALTDRSVKKAAKPSLAAWTVNHLRRDALIAKAKSLRKAQRRALSGKPSGDLRHASQAFVAVVQELIEAARDVLEKTGHATSPATLEKVRRTLEAAPTLDDDDLDRLARGHLERELMPRPFEAAIARELGGRRPRAAKPKRARVEKKPAPPREPVAKKRAEREVERLERELARARTHLDALRKGTERAA